MVLQLINGVFCLYTIQKQCMSMMSWCMQRSKKQVYSIVLEYVFLLFKPGGHYLYHTGNMHQVPVPFSIKQFMIILCFQTQISGCA